MEFWNIIMLAVLSVATLKSFFLACFVLLISTVFVCINLFSLGTSWLVFAIVLTYVGGVLVLFIYLCSLSFLGKMEFNLVYKFIFLISLLLMMMFSKNLLVENQSLSNLMAIFSVYSKFNLMIVSLAGVYLTFGLLVSMMMVQKNFGPLKWMF